MFLFPSVAHMFRIAQKLQNPNLQCSYNLLDNSECQLIDREHFRITCQGTTLNFQNFLACFCCKDRSSTYRVTD